MDNRLKIDKAREALPGALSFGATGGKPQSLNVLDKTLSKRLSMYVDSLFYLFTKIIKVFINQTPFGSFFRGVHNHRLT